MSSAQQFIAKTKDYWGSYFEVFEDLPDGAWWQSMEDVFDDPDNVKDACLACSVDYPNHCDGNDLTHEYLRQTGDDNE